MDTKQHSDENIDMIISRQGQTGPKNIDDTWPECTAVRKCLGRVPTAFTKEVYEHHSMEALKGHVKFLKTVCVSPN